MAPKQLDIEIRRKGRKEDTLSVFADPGDTRTLRGYLLDWLASNKWAEARWGEFELIAFNAGTWKRVAKVRP